MTPIDRPSNGPTDRHMESEALDKKRIGKSLRHIYGVYIYIYMVFIHTMKCSSYKQRANSKTSYERRNVEVQLHEIRTVKKHGQENEVGTDVVSE